ncbi:sulfurtransferase TusA family protein [Helicobacter burdigaliensis]|uniref:sulfurtransferase TusA family protein n=1 Tax=Helicobacter burdigaliensis TaxID=2315334 RepID=UPI000EF6D861|nr:sulfurtransferase TusA family protein [Helicobacter burdigaliensis]
MKELDVRGLSCPEPVLNLKPLIDEGHLEIKVLCSCGASSENIKRMAINHNYEVNLVESNTDEFVYLLKKKG